MNTSHSLLLTPAPVGIMISYWIGYGTNFIGGTTYPEQSSAAWRIPLAIQLVPAIILCVGSWFLPFSPRWLMLVGREEESLAVLAKVRQKDPSSPAIQYEFLALKAEALAERENYCVRYGSGDKTWRNELREYRRILTTKKPLHRVGLGAAVQTFGQWSGENNSLFPVHCCGSSGGTVISTTADSSRNQRYYILRPNRV
jgi:hypothetical protein